MEEDKGTADCVHEDAVFWNKFNRVVQCHGCGLIFVPATPEDYARHGAEWEANARAYREENPR